MDTAQERTEVALTDHGGRERDGEARGRVPIFIDDVRRFAPEPAMTGAELKVLGEVPPDYQLFLEVPGPAPDLGIRDDESVDLKPGMRFNSVVPGTLGAG